MTAFVEEVIAYVGLDDVDRRRLLALHAVLEPHFPAIADAFYKAALANPSTAAILGKPDHLARLHTTMQAWMSTGLRGPFDAAFWQKRGRIGHRHVEIGLAQHFMITGMPQIPGATMAEIERYAILESLKAAGGSTSKAAEMLGISPRTIQYRLHEYQAAQRSDVDVVQPKKDSKM